MHILEFVACMYLEIFSESAAYNSEQRTEKETNPIVAAKQYAVAQIFQLICKQCAIEILLTKNPSSLYFDLTISDAIWVFGMLCKWHFAANLMDVFSNSYRIPTDACSFRPPIMRSAPHLLFMFLMCFSCVSLLMEQDCAGVVASVIVSINWGNDFQFSIIL